MKYDIIVKAIIKNKIVKIDLAADNINDYQDIKEKIKYLGSGLYHSYNGVRASDNTITHFWKFKK